MDADEIVIENCIGVNRQLDLLNNIEKASIANFINTNGCSDATKGFIDVAIPALVEGDEVDFVEQIIYSLQNPCQKTITELALSTDSNIAQDIQIAFNSVPQGGQPEYHLNINQGTSPEVSLGERAKTTAFPFCGTAGCTFRTIFNEVYLDESTDLSIATTTIHESVHALLAYKFHTGQLTIDGITEPNLAQLIVTYTSYKAEQNPINNQTLNETQHQYMVGLINDMGDALYAWAIATQTNDGNTAYSPSNFGQFDTDANDDVDGLKEYCRKMFWSPTLRGTTNFASLPFNDRQLIEAIDQAEATGLTTQYNDLNNVWYDLQPKGNKADDGAPCNY